MGSQILCLFQKTEYRNDYPALVVELKWNKSAVSALQQIKDKNIQILFKNMQVIFCLWELIIVKKKRSMNV